MQNKNEKVAPQSYNFDPVSYFVDLNVLNNIKVSEISCKVFQDIELNKCKNQKFFFKRANNSYMGGYFQNFRAGRS